MHLSPAAVIGAGKVGRPLAVALQRLGVKVVIGERPERVGAEPADPLLRGIPTAVPAEAARDARLVLLCVQDDQLPTLITDLAAHGVFAPGQTVVHTAGVDGPGLLTPAKAAGACVVACHPIGSFTDDVAQTLERLPGTVWGVSGDSTARRSGHELVQIFGGHGLDVPESGRARYHAAIVLAANGAAALVAQAADLLRAGGVIDPGLVLEKLVHASVDSALGSGQAGLSGPWVRGDGRTVALHLEALARRNKIAQVYAGLARLVADRAAGAGRLSPEAWHRVAAVLDEQLGADRQDRGRG
jgi:predicted short-subunit dehydrogenase-like oxidoreductase (DUF2520 family)